MAADGNIQRKSRPPVTGVIGPGGGDPGKTYTSPETEIKVLSRREKQLSLKLNEKKEFKNI